MTDQTIKVLIAEDEKDIRESIAEILVDEGFEVYQAVNGKKGFELFLDYKPHVIISDIMMPEVDGYEFLKLVRESKNKFNMVPFIFLSALGQKENIIKGASLSANDYLVKPIDFEILIAKIKEKAANFMKLKKNHEKGIKNIKDQISLALPSEISLYLNSIAQKLKILIEEPYGPYPHRKYLEDIKKLYRDSLKLKSTITNSLDHEVIDNRLNADEEIFSLSNFIDKAINNLPDRIKSRITFDKPYESELLPDIKAEKSVLIDMFKYFIAGIIKPDEKSTINISLVMDEMGQMILIFYINSRLELSEIEHNLDCKRIQQIGNSQSLYFELSSNKTNKHSTITIPSIRLIEKK